ncbi:hypothetical protein HKX48_009071 [Thoreauomyces humboldtii]|nr:hypothetical protein HKX48_009071 [Thoreauomyces humboldtii]
MRLFNSLSSTFADFLILTKAYLSNALSSSLNCVHPLHVESEPIREDLLHLCRCGLVTVSSQPPLPDVQRPYVEGFMERAWFESTVRSALESETSEGIVYHVSTMGSVDAGGKRMETVCSNVERRGLDLSRPFEVTRGDKYTHVYWDVGLQDVEAFVGMRYRAPEDLVQCVFTTTRWGDEDWFRKLSRVVARTYPMTDVAG